MALRSRGKEALLLVLAVVALVVAVSTMRSRPVLPAGSSSAMPPPEQQAKATSPAKDTPVDPETIMPAANGDRNPFAAPPGAPPITAASLKPAAASRPPRGVASAAATPAPAAPPPLPTFAASAGQPASAVKPAGVQAPKPPDKPSLSGVVNDAAGRPTAVIHEGDRRYFVQAGDTVAGKYRVQSVSSQQVVLTAAGERLTLKMGGS